MLEHLKQYPLNDGTIPIIGLEKIVKAIPSMPGFLAITYFNKLIIHSLEGRIVEEQSIKDRDERRRYY
jgi:hypothetical protein